MKEIVHRTLEKQNRKLKKLEFYTLLRKTEYEQYLKLTHLEEITQNLELLNTDALEIYKSQ